MGDDHEGAEPANELHSARTLFLMTFLLLSFPLLDGRDVAKLLHLPISTVLEYARRGLLPGHKLGRRWIFLRDEIEAAVRDRPVDRSVA